MEHSKQRVSMVTQPSLHLPSDKEGPGPSSLNVEELQGGKEAGKGSMSAEKQSSCIWAFSSWQAD